MYRKINKGRSIVKILIYSVILTWFSVILIENWRNMRLSWFREVWEFIDFKTIWENMDSYLSFCVVFGAGFITLYQVIAMFARAGRNEGVPSDHFEETDNLSAEYLTKIRAKWEDDLINNPAYHDFPGNIWHRTRKRKDKDQ
jgi:TRAP-type C4-dicarboxylate transport system permease small subunit